MAVYRLQDLMPLIDTVSQTYNVPAQLMVATLVAEHSADGRLDPNLPINTDAVSPKGAFGAGQTMPATMQGLIKNGLIPANIDPKNVGDQIKLLAAGLKDSLSRSGGDWLAAAAGYNGSPAVQQAFINGGQIPDETKNYVNKVANTLGISVSKKYIPSDIVTNLLAKAADYGNKLNTNMGVLNALTGETAARGEEMKSAVDRAGAAEQEVAQVEGAKQEQEIGERKDILSLFGLDRSNNNSTLIQQNAAQAKAIQEMSNLKPQIDAARTVSPLDDPLGWAMGQIQLMQLVPKYNAAAENYNNAEQVIAGQQRAAAAQAALEPSNSVDVVKRETAAKTELAAAQAALKKAEIDRQTQISKLNAMSTEMQWLGHNVSQSLQLANTFAEHLKLNEANAEKQNDKDKLTRLNMKLVAVGAQPFSNDAEFKQLGAGDRDLLSRVAGAPPGSIAGDLGTAMEMITRFGSVNEMAKQAPNMAAFVTQTQRMAAELKQAAYLQPENQKLKDQELETKVFNQIQKNWYDQAGKGTYDKLPDDNPFKMRAQVFASAPELENNTIAQWVKQQRTSNLPLPLKDEDIARYAVAQKVAGKPLDQVVKELTDFYNYGMKNQWTSAGLGQLSLDARNPKTNQISYPVSSSILYGMKSGITGGRGVPENIDMMNAAQVQHMIVINAVKASIDQSLEESRLSQTPPGVF